LAFFFFTISLIELLSTFRSSGAARPHDAGEVHGRPTAARDAVLPGLERWRCRHHRPIRRPQPGSLHHQLYRDADMTRTRLGPFIDNHQRGDRFRDQLHGQYIYLPAVWLPHHARRQLCFGDDLHGDQRGAVARGAPLVQRPVA